MKKRLMRIIAGTLMISGLMAHGMTTKAYAESAATSQDIIISRVSGSNRYATSYEIRNKLNSGSKNLILVNGLNFADALSASALAVKEDASIILTNGISLKGSNMNLFYGGQTYNKVIIVGGASAVSTSIESEARKYANNIVRLAGSDRYETSLKVAEYIGSFDTAFVTTGLNYADALSISSVAAKKACPIILTNGSSISSGAADYINSKAGSVYVLGGTAAVSSSIDGKLKNCSRISGDTRYETNKNIISTFKSQLSSGKAYVATGTNFPDALAISGVAGKDSAAIILTALTPAQASKDIVAQNSIKSLTAVGGPTVVSPITMQKLADKAVSGNISSASSINDIYKLAKESGFVRKNTSVPEFETALYDNSGNIKMEAAFYNETEVKDSLEGYTMTWNRIVLTSKNPAGNKNELIKLLKPALPNSYEALYNLVSSGSVKSQELYLDGKIVEIVNSNGEISLNIIFKYTQYR